MNPKGVETEELSMLEKGVRRYWLASKAWYREDGFYENWDAGKLLDTLADLSEAKADKLKVQAGALMVMVINAKRRRKKVKGQVVNLQSVRAARMKQESVKQLCDLLEHGAIQLHSSQAQ